MFYTQVKNPRDPTESHGNPRNPTIVDFILRFSPGEKHTKTYGIPRTPTESHETPRNPTIMDFICLYIILYDGGAGIPIKIKHVFMWCVNQEPATCPHLMQGSLQNTIQNPGNTDPGNINSAQTYIIVHVTHASYQCMCAWITVTYIVPPILHTVCELTV